MAQLVLYIASSIDGYIAASDGNLDWLTSTPAPSNGGDYGYSDVLNSIGTILMGRSTYQSILQFGIEWPYQNKSTYVVTRQSTLSIQSPETFILKGEEVASFILDAKNRMNQDIWLVGGGQLVASCLEWGLIDKLMLTIIPKTLGSGIPLFPSNHSFTEWDFSDCQSFDSGVVSLVYQKKFG